jgi:hypothetical protein
MLDGVALPVEWAAEGRRFEISGPGADIFPDPAFGEPFTLVAGRETVP